MTRAEWKSPHNGPCAVCGRRGRLVRHHVVLAQHVRQEGGDQWDPRNSMDLGMYCRCHENHHGAVRRIPLALVPADAVAFAIDLFGAERAHQYFVRYYNGRRKVT